MTAHAMRFLKPAARRAARVLAACALATVVPLARSGAQAKALSLAEVIDLRQQGVSTRQILRNARQYCIAFALSDSVKQQLSVGGADSLLMGGLSDVCTTVRPVRVAPPAIIDDDLAHTAASQAFAWGDRRCKARFESGGVRVENRTSDAICFMRYPSPELSAGVRRREAPFSSALAEVATRLTSTPSASVRTDAWSCVGTPTACAARSFERTASTPCFLAPTTRISWQSSCVARRSR